MWWPTYFGININSKKFSYLYFWYIYSIYLNIITNVRYFNYIFQIKYNSVFSWYSETVY